MVSLAGKDCIHRFSHAQLLQGGTANVLAPKRRPHESPANDHNRRWHQDLASSVHGNVSLLSDDLYGRLEQSLGRRDARCFVSQEHVRQQAYDARCRLLSRALLHIV